jgi:hypothetical protein
MQAVRAAVVAGIFVVLGLWMSGCGMDGISRAKEGTANAVAPVPFPQGVDRISVRIGTFAVSPAVVIPAEMKEIEQEQLKALAVSNARHAMSCCLDVDVLPDAGSSSLAAESGVLTLVGEVHRVQLTGEIDDQLAGNMFSKAKTTGTSAIVYRTLALDIQYRLLRADGVAVAAGSGQSEVRVPITGTVVVSADSPNNGSGSAARTMKDGKVDRGSLAPAFEMASSTGARNLLVNYIAKATRGTANAHRPGLTLAKD